MKEMEGLMNSFMGGGDDIFGGFFGDKEERKENAGSPFKQFFQTSNDDDEESPISPFKQIFQIHDLIFNSVDGQNDKANDKNNDRADDRGNDKANGSPNDDDNDDVCGVCVNITTVRLMKFRTILSFSFIYSTNETFQRLCRLIRVF